MNFEEFIKKIGYLPVINRAMLLSGMQNPGSTEVQISRWQKTGKLIKMKKGIYLLAEPYRKVDVFPAHIAAVLKNPSYISLEKALEFHGLIPEAVSVYTSITTKRPAKFVNPLGTFSYQHIQTALFWGYESVRHQGQTAFMATPEKALLDFFYLNHMRISRDYLEEFRLQNIGNINRDRLFEYARRFKKPKSLKCAQAIADYMEEYKRGEKTL